MASGQQNEALHYARQHFSEFAAKHMTDIQHLMGSFLYISRLPTSPYAHLFHPTHTPTLWSDVVHTFLRDSCVMMGLSQESPLHVAITAGWKALPTFIKLASFQVLQQRAHALMQQSAASNPATAPTPTPSSSTPLASPPTNPEGSASTEQAGPAPIATVEVDLGKEYQFHSIFACPVSREQSTKDNPPVMLVCGHVISKASMSKLVKGPSSRLKCPYCPTEQLSSQARQVFF